MLSSLAAGTTVPHLWRFLLAAAMVQLISFCCLLCQSVGALLCSETEMGEEGGRICQDESAHNGRINCFKLHKLPWSLQALSLRFSDWSAEELQRQAVELAGVCRAEPGKPAACVLCAQVALHVRPISDAGVEDRAALAARGVGEQVSWGMCLGTPAVMGTG